MYCNFSFRKLWKISIIFGINSITGKWFNFAYNVILEVNGAQKILFTKKKKIHY